MQISDGKGRRPPTSLIAVSCGINISAMHCLVLSQSTGVTGGRTDGQTDRITTPKKALA